MKNYFILIIFVPIIALIPLLGCSQQGTSPFGYASYFPLVSGRVITYEVTSHSETVDPTDHHTIVTETTSHETWEYIGAVPVTSTLEVFKVNTINSWGGSYGYYREDSTGVYVYGVGADKNPTTQSVLFLKYPLDVGASWESSSFGGRAQVLLDENMVTAAGTFLCRKVSFSGQTGISSVYYWFAKDIGFIKGIITLTSTGSGNSWMRYQILSKNF